jgi:hypothetical protein
LTLAWFRCFSGTGSAEPKTRYKSVRKGKSGDDYVFTTASGEPVYPGTVAEAADIFARTVSAPGAVSKSVTVDTLVTAGIANSRAELLRWALGRIR